MGKIINFENKYFEYLPKNDEIFDKKFKISALKSKLVIFENENLSIGMTSSL